MRRSYSFNNILGLDFNPVTGNLCETANGHEFGDEINLVTPGFDSGWIGIQGISSPDNLDASDNILNLIPGNSLAEQMKIFCKISVVTENIVVQYLFGIKLLVLLPHSKFVTLINWAMSIKMICL